jgi:hypothetical protein
MKVIMSSLMYVNKDQSILLLLTQRMAELTFLMLKLLMVVEL